MLIDSGVLFVLRVFCGLGWRKFVRIGNFSRRCLCRSSYGAHYGYQQHGERCWSHCSNAPLEGDGAPVYAFCCTIPYQRTFFFSYGASDIDGDFRGATKRGTSCRLDLCRQARLLHSVEVSAA